MALTLTPTEQIVNVQWESGLAVEFEGRPSYLTLNQSLKMNKVVISFWFRIPQAVAQQVQERDAAKIEYDFPAMHGVIPLLMFGSGGMGTVYEWSLVKTDEKPVVYDVSAPPVMEPLFGNQIVGNHSAPMQPSCIGVAFGPDSPDGQLKVNLQSADMANASNLRLQSSTSWVATDPAIPTVGFEVITYTDGTYSETAAPVFLGNSFEMNKGKSEAPATVTTDAWHHLLISWDLQSNKTHGIEDGGTTDEATSAYSLMWCALDNVNRDKYDLPALWIGGWGYGSHESLGSNPNGHLCWLAWKYAGLSPISEGGPQSVDVTFTDLPSISLILPASPTVAYASDASGGIGSKDFNQMVEMAELQIFCDVTLDTSDATNRRAFIDFERNEEGAVIVDEDGNGTLKPVDPVKAQELLNTKPKLLLHGTKNWQEGKNTGSEGIDPEGNELPGGQLEPTGNIIRYPDPAITQNASL